MSENKLMITILKVILNELREIKKELKIANKYLKPVPMDLSKYLPKEVNPRRDESR